MPAVIPLLTPRSRAGSKRTKTDYVSQCMHSFARTDWDVLLRRHQSAHLDLSSGRLPDAKFVPYLPCMVITVTTSDNNRETGFGVLTIPSCTASKVSLCVLGHYLGARVGAFPKQPARRFRGSLRLPVTPNKKKRLPGVLPQRSRECPDRLQR